MISYKEGDIFNSECQTLVNPVNSVGVMGAGLAKEFRSRYPVMFDDYVDFCRNGGLSVDGSLHLWRGPEKWVLNFPTKKHWRSDSSRYLIEAGLEEFNATYQREGITSVAFPALGCGLGNARWGSVMEVMEDNLSLVDIPVEIYMPKEMFR